MDSKIVVEIYSLDVIFYATGGHTWIYKAHFLSSMRVCHWNEIDEYDYDYNPSSTYVGKNCTYGSSEVNGLFLGEF